MMRYLLPLAAVGVLAVPGPGADLKSGLQPGEAVPVFHPLMVTGPSAGQKQCPV